jgi:hypothetical protein
MLLVRKRIQSLTVQFNKLTIEERNLIGFELTEVFGKVMQMIHKVSHNLNEEMRKPIPGFSSPVMQL